MNIGPGTVIFRDVTEIFGLLQMTPMAITIARRKKLDDVLRFAVWTIEANASGVEVQINVLVTLSSIMGHGRRVETITLCDLYLTKAHFILLRVKPSSPLVLALQFVPTRFSSGCSKPP